MQKIPTPRALSDQIFQPFLASEYPPVPAGQAAFHIIPAPLEASVSYGGGARLGPAALLAASQQLEALENGCIPGETGFYTLPPIDCSGQVDDALARIATAVGQAISCGAIPVLLGGEHTVTLGALRAFAAQKEPLGIVQIDAHADLRPEYMGNPLSHASVMYRAVADLGLPLAQFACRELCRDEERVRRKFGIVHHDAAELADRGFPDPALPQDFPRRLYISFDVDGLDASLMPATGTPSPGGLLWHDARRLLACLTRNRQIAGMDIVEFAPIPGLHHADFTAAKLAHLLMALACRANKLSGEEKV